MGQSGRPPRLGRGSRRFKSCHLDGKPHTSAVETLASRRPAPGDPEGWSHSLQERPRRIVTDILHRSSTPKRFLPQGRHRRKTEEASRRLGCPSARSADSKSTQRGSTPRRPAESKAGGPAAGFEHLWHHGARIDTAALPGSERRAVPRPVWKAGTPSGVEFNSCTSLLAPWTTG